MRIKVSPFFPDTNICTNIIIIRRGSRIIKRTDEDMIQETPKKDLLVVMGDWNAT